MYTIAILCMLKIYQFRYSTVHNTVYVHHCHSLYTQDISVQVQYCTQYSLCTPLPFSVYSRYISSLTVLYTIQFLYTIAIRFMLKMYQFRYSTVHNTVHVHHCYSMLKIYQFRYSIVHNTVYVHHRFSLYAQDISVQVQYCTQYS